MYVDEMIGVEGTNHLYYTQGYSIFGATARAIKELQSSLEICAI